jgi:hypothetical protein
MEEHQAVCSKEKADLQAQLDTVQAENEQLKSELRQQQDVAEAENQMNLLREQFDVLHQECRDKDATLAELTDKLKKTAELSGRMAQLDKLHIAKSDEVGELRKLEGATHTGKELMERLDRKDEDVASLTQKLRLAEATCGKVESLGELVRHKDEHIRQLECRVKEMEMLPMQMATLLEKLGVDEPLDSFVNNWEALEKKLAPIIGQARRSGIPNAKDGPFVDEGRQGRMDGKRKVLAGAPSEKDRAVPRIAAEEYLTTEVVYRQHSVRRSVSASPRKARFSQPAIPAKRQKTRAGKPETHITPFSQVQWDPNIQGQSSPQSPLTDISNMFATIPASLKGREPEDQDRMGSEKAKYSQIAKSGTRGSEKPREEQVLGKKARATADGPANRLRAGRGPQRFLFPLDERDANTPGAESSDGVGMAGQHRMTGAEDSTEGSKENKAVPLPQTSAENQGRIVQLRGILKETALTPSSGGQRLIRTPVKERKVGRAGIQRRESRTSSAYFESPAGSLGSKRGAQAMEAPMDNAAQQTRSKTRRRSKGMSESYPAVGGIC